MASIFSVNSALPNYAQVVRHHDTAIAAIDLHFANPGSEYAAFTQKELDGIKEYTVKGQELRDMMALLAFLEACFRLDYIFRKESKLKDALSKRLIRIFNQKRNKAALMDDIIKGWLREGALSHGQYDRINSAFQLRNWIAHGQYWSPSKIKPHDFYEVAEFIEGLINAQVFETGVDLAGS